MARARGRLTLARGAVSADVALGLPPKPRYRAGNNRVETGDRPAAVDCARKER